MAKPTSSPSAESRLRAAVDRAGGGLALRAFTLALFVLVAAQIETHAGGDGTSVFFSKWIYNAVGAAAALTCLVRGRTGENRATWTLIGLAIASWTAGNVYYTFVSANLQVVPSPSWADAGFLGVYPPAYLALGLLVRARVTRFSRSVWLDGVIAGLTMGAVAVAFVFAAVAAKATGGLAPIATNLAYPIADALLIAIVVGVLALRSWSLDASWILIGAGFGVFAVSDSVYLLRVAAGSYQYGTWLDLGWLAGFVLLANAAWVRPSTAPVKAFEGLRVLVIPVIFVLSCLGLVIVDHFRHLSTFAVSLTWVALGVVVLRMALTFSEHLELVSTFRVRSLTDPLTSLGNRRAMINALTEVLAAEPVVPHLLLLFDLNGFKTYNDTFGHVAGDALLHRLGARLHSAVSGRGTAFRLGGDEFCVLLPGGHQDLEWASAATVSSLRESGEGFAITCAVGHAELPVEAVSPDDALRVADRRMYASKASRGSTAESRSVLLQALAERDEELGHHIGKVARLASLMASAAGLSDSDVGLARLAAELHDVGKLAIPENILLKPGPLDEQEWELVRQHTLIGQRIIAAAPGLETVALAVRSSHERWDGAGYPDRLSGDEIPAVSRIIAICDAYDAMTAERPYRPRMSHEQAVAELRAQAGKQFDPIYVEVFVNTLDVVERSDDDVPPLRAVAR